MPALAQGGVKGLFFSFDASDAQGGPLASLNLAGECTLEAEPVCRLRLEQTRLDTPLLSGAMTGEAVVRLEAGRVVLRSLDVRMDHARLSLGQPERVPDGEVAEGTERGDGAAREMGLRLQASGSRATDTRGRAVWTLDKLTLATDQGLTLSGSARLGPEGSSVRMAVNLADPARLDRALALGLPRALLPETLSPESSVGPLVLDITASGPDGLSALPNGPFTLAASLGKGVRLPGVVISPASLRAEVFPGPGFSARGELRLEGALSASGWTVSSPTASFDVAREGEAWVVRSLALQAPGMLAPGAAAPSPLPEVGLSGRAAPREREAGGGWLVERVEVSSGGQRLSGSGVVGGTEGSRLRLSGGNLDLAALAPALQAGSGLPAQDWMLAGALGLDLDARLAPGGELRARASLDLKDASYMSPPADHMAQGLQADLAVDIRSRGNALSGSAMLAAKGGELLEGAYYVNLGQHPLTLEARGGRTAAGELRGLDLRADWTGLARLRADADATPPAQGKDWADWGAWRGKGSVELAGLDLEAAWDILADGMGLTNFQGAAGLSGSGSLTLEAQAGEDAADLSGGLLLEGVGLSSMDGSLELAGASLDLPVAYRLRGPAPEAGADPARWGALRVGLLRAPGLEAETLETRAALAPNRLLLADPLRLPLLGGEAVVSGFRVDAPLSPDFALRLRLAARGLDLSRIPGSPVAMQGTLGGDLGEVVLTRDGLIAPGALTGTWFGGALTVDGLYAVQPFAAYRTVGAAARVRGLDLEALSRALDVGRVTGRLDMDL
ncbi:MAG: hypothetical protein AB7D51_14185, partial [Desulfovibrionaceae bacterium]